MTIVYSKNKQTKMDMITNLLLDPEFSAGLPPKLIAVYTKIPESNVRTLVRQMDNLTQPVRGIYRVVVNGGDRGVLGSNNLHLWNYHNLTLTYASSYTGNEVKTTKEIGICNLVLGISTTGNCYCQMSTDYPANLSSLSLILEVFRLFVKEYEIDMNVNDVTVKAIEFNQDYKNLKLEGVNCITVNKLIEQFKVYNRPYGLRLEHKTTVSIQARDIMDMLTNQPDTSKLEETIKSQDKKLALLGQQLNYLIQKMGQLQS